MLQVNIDVSDLQKATHLLENELKNPANLLGQIGLALVYETEQNFRNESGPLGKWDLLSPLTTKQRAKRGHWPGKILQVKGSLASSIQSTVSGDVVTVSAGSGPSKEYAAIHQFGGEAGRGKSVEIKARPYLPIIGSPDKAKLSDDVLKNVLGIVEDHLTSVLNNVR